MVGGGARFGQLSERGDAHKNRKALAAVGLAIGMATALGASKFVASFLYGMKPNDPIALAVAILLGAALLAGYVPARKASRIDPMIAIRHE